MLFLLGIVVLGCSAGNTEQTRTTVSDFNVFEGRNASSETTQDTNSTGNSLSSASESSIEGSWKLVSSSGGYPHAIGSSLTITDHSFALTQPNASGTYSISGSVFTFSWGEGLDYNFNYNLSGNTLSFNGIGSNMNMVYTRN